MPLREEVCRNRHCPAVDVVEEHYYHSSAMEPRPCEHCGGPTERLASRFGVIWTGPIGPRYRDKNIEGYHLPDGMDVWAKNTASGKPEPRHLESWGDVKDYCKSEGLRDPRELGKNMEVGEDGKSASFRGVAGQEI